MMKSEEAKRQCHAMSYAFTEVARVVGRDSPIYKAMGSLAWGRYEDEPCPNWTKDRVMRGLGYLRGQRDALMNAARVAGWAGVRHLECFYDIVNERLSK